MNVIGDAWERHKERLAGTPRQQAAELIVLASQTGITDPQALVAMGEQVSTILRERAAEVARTAQATGMSLYMAAMSLLSVPAVLTGDPDPLLGAGEAVDPLSGQAPWYPVGSCPILDGELSSQLQAPTWLAAANAARYDALEMC